jgi:chitinase
VLATREVAGLEEEMFFPVELDADLLKEGANIIAVEVHQDSSKSPDLSFDLELLANLAEPRFAPDLAFVTPFNGELFQLKRSIPIEVEALDSDGEIRAVSVYADGDLLGSDGDAPYHFEWQGAPLGIHQLRAEAVDTDGLQSTVDATITVVNNTPPIVALTSPADGAKFDTADTIRLAAQASDPGGAVENVKFYSHTGGLFAERPRVIAAVDEAPYEFDLRNLEPGHYMINAIATDNRGATSSAVTVYIEVTGDYQGRTFLPVINR